MAKRKEETKPLFPLKGEFYASLDHFANMAGMLSDAAQQAIDLGAVTGPAAKILKERVDAFEAARFGGSEG